MSRLEKVTPLENLNSFIDEILEFSNGCEIFLLEGDLASGKTTFVQKFAKKLGLKDTVTSPTFSVQQTYGEKFFHYDIYQNGVNNFISSGLLEELDKDGYHMIEWSNEKLEKVLDSYMYDFIKVKIEKADEKKRKYKVTKCIH
jgi:tRNA threonylcarbamoyladenosine biosynthesis protein TsaE